MKTVLVTGAYGFIGKNLCAKLETNPDIQILKFGRGNTDEDLSSYVQRADFIFHIAGINRPENEEEFKTGNSDLTKRVTSLIEEKKSPTPLLITSSTHADRDTPYGRSKKDAEEIVKTFAKKSEARSYIFRLPNVFGKWSNPNYNSAIATFCHNISRSQPITVSDPNISLSLVYIDDVVTTFVAALNDELDEQPDFFYDIPRVFNVTLGAIVEKLTAFKDSRKSLVIPDFEDPFDRFLYATYLSFLPENDFGYSLEMKSDDRGWLSEFIKSDHFGQIFISKTKPGISRGNHWHHTKIEKFLVIDGTADIKFRKIGTNEIITYSVDGKAMRVIDIPAGYVHSITNTGENDLLTVFWADEVFNPETPDTFYQNV